MTIAISTPLLAVTCTFIHENGEEYVSYERTYCADRTLDEMVYRAWCALWDDNPTTQGEWTLVHVTENEDI
jgi:hypothetical protein